MLQRNAARFIYVFFLLALAAVAEQAAPQAQRSISSTGYADLDQYRASRIDIYTDDFGQLARYREADAALAPPAAKESRKRREKRKKMT